MDFTTTRKTDFKSHPRRKSQFMQTSIADLTETPKMYETENDLAQNRRSEMNALMNQRLADAVDR